MRTDSTQPEDLRKRRMYFLLSITLLLIALLSMVMAIVSFFTGHYALAFLSLIFFLASLYPIMIATERGEP